MLWQLLGPEVFRRGTDMYFSRHDGQAVTCDDFVAAMEEVSGRDFTQFKRWYTQAGTPRLAVSGAYDADARTYTLSVSQSCPPTPGQSHKEPFHIPLALALLGDAGALRLQLEGREPDFDSADNTELVLDITETQQKFVFTQIPEHPVPSLLRGFSAPVKLQFPYSRADLLFLMSRDSDGFCRWDAGQPLAVAALQDMVEAYLAEIAEVVDVAALHAARQAARLQIARALRDSLWAVYRANQCAAPYAPSAAQIAQRSLKNICLNYLMLLEVPEAVAACVEQFERAPNMTDVMAALAALVNSTQTAAKEQALAQFYARWQHEALVVNQWFQVQATCVLPGALDAVQQLMQHPAFDIKNPNKVRALIGAFAGGNAVNFHSADGAAYRFLADQVLFLNRTNPQIAARLLPPLSKWQKYPPAAQQLMVAELRRIAADPALSPDVFEVVAKSLAQAEG
jgi:aminopeptidase N